MTKKRILVVDDAPENIDILKAILEGDYDIQAATGAEVALKILRSSGAPDLILLDVVMPQMSGLELYEILKEKEDTALIPVIFITGSREVNVDFTKLQGSPLKLNKPVDPGILVREINRILEKGKS